ncbi:ABC transporter permease [uncultured Alsobacter sp.]|uniref:ABC transporter permease n=1 Tax=uncultured Alsobacter sp. TaxID=1748258 RepID=UPI0025DB1718|nr:ABC transporter permease [uncultured Alsobacter sp.]
MTSFQRILATLRRNAVAAVPTILAIVVLNFFLLRLAPGDAADVLAGESGAATEELMRQLRARFGLDLPVLIQLKNYLLGLAQGSLGFSPRYNMPVTDLILQRLPVTVALMASALVVAFVVGVTAGYVMALCAGRWPDRVLSVVALLLYSLPGFWIGLMLIVAFSVKLGWLPSGGSETIASGLTGVDLLLDRLRHLVLPATTLALFYVAIYARLTRASVLEVSELDFVRTARAKGVGGAGLALRHILRNALIPVTTMAGIHVGGVLGGAVVVETVFTWPGMGRLAFEAVQRRDFAVLLGVLFLSSIVVIVVNMLVDLLQAWLDPRIEAS